MTINLKYTDSYFLYKKLLQGSPLTEVIITFRESVCHYDINVVHNHRLNLNTCSFFDVTQMVYSQTQNILLYQYQTLSSLLFYIYSYKFHLHRNLLTADMAN